jgi:WD40 repeat protein
VWASAIPTLNLLQISLLVPISSDGGTAKIVWGTRAGDVLFMNAPRAMDGGRRSAADDVTDEHDGSVLDAQWVINAPSAALGWPVVTASADGRIKLWDAKTAVCRWTSQRKSNVVIPNPCLKVTAIQTGVHGGCIAAVMKSGEVHIWTGFPLGATVIYEESSDRETIIESLMCTSTHSNRPTHRS